MAAAGDRDSTGAAYVPALNDYDMYINDSQGAVDTSEMNEPGDVPNEEIRKARLTLSQITSYGQPHTTAPQGHDPYFNLSLIHI